MTVIEVQNLRKTYGDTVAVRDVSFTVERGEIFGILGPNGAGKTTTVESITGLRAPDSGTIRVLGRDPGDKSLRRDVGVQLQESQLPDKLTVREALDLYASFYPEPADWRALTRELGLTEKLGTAYGKLSGVRNSGSPSRSRSSGARRSRFSTSSRPGSTRGPAATRGT
ncbi:hypothetical protein Abr02nite_21860 [Paractinoplanes brasiliensis]|nr:hypothetical protein Abr02nite_21860 [Actinoplanes brasiliensis]